MGEVVDARALFRDRRNQAVQKPLEIDVSYTKNSLHDHLRDLHGWGGPKSTTKEALDRIHHNGHADPVDWWKPHTHI